MQVTQKIKRGIHRERSGPRRSGQFIRIELTINQGDLVFQEQFSFLHALEREWILQWACLQLVNGLIQIAMFQNQLLTPRFKSGAQIRVDTITHGLLTRL